MNINYTILTLFSEIYFLINFIFILIYYNIYTISNKLKNIISYKINLLFPIIILTNALNIIINQNYLNQYLLEYTLYINNYTNLFKYFSYIILIIILIASFTFIKLFKLNNFETIILILSTHLGSLLLLSSNNIILIYINVELITITVYILVALNKLTNYTIESGLKYFIIGATSSGMLLIGISLIYGSTGCININDIILYTINYNNIYYNNFTYNIYIILSAFFILSSLLFKIYSAPFHLWISDIYQGSPMNILYYISTIPSLIYTITLIKFLEIYNNLYPINYFIIIISIITITLGTLGALLQKKFKKLLAYSSISHMGYFLLSIFVYLFGNSIGLFTFIFYYISYLINLSLLFSQLLNNNKYLNKLTYYNLNYLSNYKGYYLQNAYGSLLLSVALFSISGIPPFSGFFSKLYLFYSFIYSNISLYIIIYFIFITVISAYYYLNIIKNIFFINNKHFIIKKYNILNTFISIIITTFLFLFILSLNNYSIIINYSLNNNLI